MNIVGSSLIGLCVLRAPAQLALNYCRAVLFQNFYMADQYVQQGRRCPQGETFLAHSRSRNKTVIHVVTIVTVTAEVAIVMVRVKFSPSTP